VGGGGKVYITGGLRNDGSGIAFGETYTFDPASGFTQSAPLPRAVYHHSSILMPNGTLIVLGGVSISMSTGVPAAQSLDTISVFDTTNVDAVWTEHMTSAVAPSPRRGMAAVLSSDGKEIFINGGASTTFDQVYADSWNLDVDTLQWRQVGQSVTRRRMKRQVNSEPGPRYDHSAALGPDGQVVILGGKCL
jgi:N-acetylneuraminic acid mutarotase